MILSQLIAIILLASAVFLDHIGLVVLADKVEELEKRDKR